MARRNGAVHVATTRRKYKGKVYQTQLLRRTYRDGGQVKHETLGNISHLPKAVIEMIRGALRGDVYAPAAESFEIVRTLPHGHVAAVLGTLRRLKLETLIGRKHSWERDLVVAMIVARVLDPRSKLATVRGLHEETAFTSLGQILGVERATEDDLYEAMDWLLKRQSRIESKLAARHLVDGSLVLYDVSSSYYTGSHCELARLGYSRDRKKGFPQIVYGLLCNRDGCPVAVEVFAGNVADPKTLGAQINKVRGRFGLQRIVWVGDRGMITSARIREELEPLDLDWITALRAPAIRKLADAGVVHPTLFDARDLAEVQSPEYPGERLMACRNPFLATERARKRQELLEATERELAKITEATQRPKRAFRGKDKIGLRVGRVLNRYKMGKHFKLKITDEGFTYRRNEQKIAAEAALDGIYIIRTSVAAEELTPEATVRTYKQLSVVERAFRSLKTVDLHVRPIYHRLANRVRAHVFLCVLAYYVEWHMRQTLAPMLFDDEDKALAETMRKSVVAPAKRSSRALRKASSKRTDQGEPVHSFRTLLQDLQTLAKNRVRPLQASDASDRPVEFDLLTTPTPLQRRAFELLSVSLAP